MSMTQWRAQNPSSFLHSVLSAPAGIAQGRGALVRSVTVPLRFTDNRVFIDLTLVRADGKLRTARFWVDTGGGS
jgi:hypothetical protein